MRNRWGHCTSQKSPVFLTEIWLPAGKGSGSLFQVQDLWQLLASSGFSLCSSAKKRRANLKPFFEKKGATPRWFFFRRGTMLWHFAGVSVVCFFFLGGADSGGFLWGEWIRVFLNIGSGSPERHDSTNHRAFSNFFREQLPLESLFCPSFFSKIWVVGLRAMCMDPFTCILPPHMWKLSQWRRGSAA